MDILSQLYHNLTGCKVESATLLPLSGSARKYYRLTGEGGVFIGCKGTNFAENKAFISIAGCFEEAGLHAPKVYAASDDGMCYLQEDLGEGQLFALLTPSVESGKYSEEQLGWLHDCMSLLPAVQFKVGERMNWDVCFPDREFNARMVSFDLNYFKYDFLKFTGLEFNEIRLQDDFDRITSDSLAFEGNTFMYRDFQARNVMIGRGGEPCFIDFQGGRRGPVQYDLASFLWNAGTHFSKDLRAELERIYLRALSNFRSVDEEQFYEEYRLLTLVRLLQETGAYGFRGIVERKQLFLDCIPMVLKAFGELTEVPFKRYPYVNEVLTRLSCEWDGSTILPGVGNCLAVGK